MTAMAENPASHKYDVAKGTSIHNAFFVKAKYSSFNKIKKFVGMTELNFFFRELSQVISMLFSFSSSVKKYGIGWT